MKLTDKQREALVALRDVMIDFNIVEIGVDSHPLAAYIWIDDFKFPINQDMYFNEEHIDELLEQDKS